VGAEVAGPVVAGVDAEANGAAGPLEGVALDPMKVTAFGDMILGDSRSGEPPARGAALDGGSGGTVGVEGDRGMLLGIGTGVLAAAGAGEDCSLLALDSGAAGEEGALPPATPMSLSSAAWRLRVRRICIVVFRAEVSAVGAPRADAVVADGELAIGVFPTSISHPITSGLAVECAV
jgi:hypothetical protein